MLNMTNRQKDSSTLAVVGGFWRRLDFEWVFKSTDFTYNHHEITTTNCPGRRLGKICFGDGLVDATLEALRCKKKHFALYLLQNMSFLGVVKYTENKYQK